MSTGTVMVHEGEHGVPVASPTLLDRLTAIDPKLGLKPFRFGDNGIEWAATFRWESHDPRRERIQTGEIAPDQDFDIVAFIPLRVSLDEIPSYIEHGLTAMQAGGTYTYVHRMLGRIRSENQKAPTERWAKVIDDAMERFETHASLASPDVIKVAGAEIHNTGKKKKAK